MPYAKMCQPATHWMLLNNIKGLKPNGEICKALAPNFINNNQSNLNFFT